MSTLRNFILTELGCVSVAAISSATYFDQDSNNYTDISLRNVASLIFLGGSLALAVIGAYYYAKKIIREEDALAALPPVVVVHDNSWVDRIEKENGNEREP